MANGRKGSSATSSTLSDSPLGDPSTPPSSIAAQAIRASSAYRDSSLASAYADSAFRPPQSSHSQSQSNQDSMPYEYTSMKSLNGSKYGFWSALTKKAKSILEDDNVCPQSETRNRTKPQMHVTSRDDQFHQTY